MTPTLPLVGDTVNYTDFKAVTVSGTVRFVHPRGQADGKEPWLDIGYADPTTPNDRPKRTITAYSIPYRNDQSRALARSGPYWTE